jgi:acetyltransferase-like isoleucine patch superfamily enzyme
METTFRLSPSNTFERIKSHLVSHPSLKKWVHFLLVQPKQARPRWFTRWLINPFVHQKKSGSIIRRTARLDVFPFQAFELGKNSTIEDFCVLTNGVGSIIIGDECRIGIGSVIMGPVSIGNSTILGQHVLITGLDHNYQSPHVPIKDQGVSTKATHIGKDSFIGANASILPGVSIGDHCVVAAGSVVTKSFPSHSVIGGNPAKLIKQYSFETNNWEKV